jgi:MFS family permease
LNARWLIANDLGVPGDNGQMSWIAAGFSITTGSFVLVGGRLGDVYGHRIVWLLALAWSMIWNLSKISLQLALPTDLPHIYSLRICPLVRVLPSCPTLSLMSYVGQHSMTQPAGLPVSAPD